MYFEYDLVTERKHDAEDAAEEQAGVVAAGGVAAEITVKGDAAATIADEAAKIADDVRFRRARAAASLSSFLPRCMRASARLARAARACAPTARPARRRPAAPRFPPLLRSRASRCRSAPSSST